MSQRALIRKYSVGDRTVRKALDSAWPEPRRPQPARGSVLDDFKPWIDAILLEDLTAPRKQRHTVTRLYDRLLSERGMSGVSYGTVRRYVTQRRPEIARAAGKPIDDAFVPQTHQPGADAEVDFGEVVVKLRGAHVTLTLFCLRLSYSGKAVHRVSASAGQEAFFEGHAHAFRVLGAVPTGKIRYDNLKAAVDRVIGLSRRRVETDRWVAFRSHYGIDAFYCQPGIGGAHEKGGVEGEIGRFRRRRFVPVPEVDSIDELNELIDVWDLEDEARRIGARAHTVGEYFAHEQPRLAALPEDRFETGRWFTPRVDRYGQITVRMNKYSVPARLIGREIRALLHSSELVVYDGQVEVARHERVIGKGEVRLNLDHYLETLVRKPGAFPGSTALAQAKASGKFTPVHEHWWAAACKIHGDTEGTRALIEVLLLHRHMRHEDVVAGLAQALRVGAFTADAVALEARMAIEDDTGLQPRDQRTLSGSKTAELREEVSSLTERRMVERLRSLPPDNRPLPSVEAYDQLLPSRRHRREDHNT